MSAPHYTDGPVTVWHGDCIEVMRDLPDASVDAVVTDPPYNLTAGKKGGRGEASVNLDSPYGRARISTGNGGGFMGKGWDDYDSYIREDGSPGSFQHWCEDWAREAYRLLRPDLMRWLVKLVTPKDGVVLEPFAGSGTTVEACVLEGFHCIAIEREADYLPLILKRVRKPHAVGLDFGEWEA